MNILITDNRYEKKSRLVAELAAEFGHSVLYKSNVVSPDFLEREYKENHFDLIVEDLDKFLIDELPSTNKIAEEMEYHIVEFIGKILKESRLKKSWSLVQLGNHLVSLKKARKLKFPLLSEKNAANLVRLFESGDFCPPHSYLDNVANLCSEEARLENFLSSLEILFRSEKGIRERRSTTVALLNIYYKKCIHEIKKIVNPANSDNILNLLQYKNFEPLE